MVDSKWADKVDGIKADGLLPEADRLLTDNGFFTGGNSAQPIYVIRGSSITIKGNAEKNQRYRITTRTKVAETYQYYWVGNSNCKQTLDKDGNPIQDYDKVARGAYTP